MVLREQKQCLGLQKAGEKAVALAAGDEGKGDGGKADADTAADAEQRTRRRQAQKASVWDPKELTIYEFIGTVAGAEAQLRATS